MGAFILLGAGAVICWPEARHPATLLLASGPIEGTPSDLFVNLHHEDGNVRLVMRDYFNSAGSLATPYVTLDKTDSATLHLDVKREFSLMSTKCEFLRQVVVAVPASVLSGRTRLIVVNHDSDHTMTKMLGGASGAASSRSNEEFVASKIAC